MKAHTDKTYDAQLNDLRNKLLSLGGKVETEIATSVRALAERDSKLAESVIDQDREVNRLEVEVDDVWLGAVLVDRTRPVVDTEVMQPRAFRVVS